MVRADGNVWSGRMRILSDLHLGHPASLVDDVTALRPLLEGVDTVVFNGDTCELTCAGWRHRGLEMLGALRGLCQEAGVRPVFLTGNHDPEISDTGWLDGWDGVLMVTHGDLIHREVAPWSREYLRRKARIAAILEDRGDPGRDLRYRWETAQMVEEVLKVDGNPTPKRKSRFHVVTALWPPERPWAMVRAWATMFDAVGGFLARYRPEARVMVFGHFHRPGVARRDGRMLISTGAFMRGASPLSVDITGDWLRVRKVQRRVGGPFSPGAGVEVLRLGGRQAPDDPATRR